MYNDVLVSCCVLAYNSAKTILETLDSIKAQTYQNIELIISDDYSTDNTVELCREWIEQNGKRFVRVELLTVDHNTGICANCNRVLNASQGVWRKGIAADDKLLPNCVKDFMEFVATNPDARWISSNMRVYKETFEECNYLSNSFTAERSFFELTAEEQFKKIVTANHIKAPSLFYSVALLREVGGYDNSYTFEDYPLYVRILEKGYKCYFMDKETVCYRLHQSFSNSSDKLFNYNRSSEYRSFQENILFNYLSRRQIKRQRHFWKIQDFIEQHGLNKKTKLMTFIYARLRIFYFR